MYNMLSHHHLWVVALVHKYTLDHWNLPEVYEISQPLLSVVWLFFSCIGRHVKGALAEKSLWIGRHVGQVVHNNEHLDHRTKWIEEGHLYGATAWNIVTLLTKVDMPL